MVAARSARYASVSSSALLLLVLLLLLAACSSKVGDGTSCDKNTDCESGRCSGGSCDGSDCTCEGSDCRTRSSCLEGWLCTRGGVTEDIIPRCRLQCTGTSSCPSDRHCDNGVCKTGPEPFALSWLNIPRTTACSARVPCEYKVKPSADTTVDTYTWSFGSAPAVDTKEPTTTFTYPTRGTYPVKVKARSTTGAIAELSTNEVLCQGAVGDVCDTSTTLCCQGTCIADLCK